MRPQKDQVGREDLRVAFSEPNELVSRCYVTRVHSKARTNGIFQGIQPCRLGVLAKVSRSDYLDSPAGSRKEECCAVFVRISDLGTSRIESTWTINSLVLLRVPGVPGLRGRRPDSWFTLD